MVIIKNVRTDIDKLSEIKKLSYKMKRARVIPMLYIITLPIMGDGVLEIYDYNTLLQPFFKKRFDTIKVVGISKSKKGIMEVLRKLYEEMSQKDENLNVRDFLGV